MSAQKKSVKAFSSQTFLLYGDVEVKRYFDPNDTQIAPHFMLSQS